jgi:Fe-S cluster assembly ATP-binding protein
MLVLDIKNITVEVDGNIILKNFTLNIPAGETHVLLGPNGAGKSTLIYAVLGYPQYHITEGQIFFEDENITNLPTYERVRRGIGVLFQHPPAVPGVKLGKLLQVTAEQRAKYLEGWDPDTHALGCTDDDDEYCVLPQRMKITDQQLDRSVNLGFSGGEVKRSEIMQMMSLKPKLLIFDEPDSGVDVENVELIGNVMRELLERDLKPIEQKRSGLIITHLGYILQFLGYVDRAHVMLNGKIQCSGRAETIMNSVKKSGFEGCLASCAACAGDIVWLDKTEA